MSSSCCLLLFLEFAFLCILLLNSLFVGDGLSVWFYLLSKHSCVDLFHSASELPKQLGAGGFRWRPLYAWYIQEDNILLQMSRESAYELVIHQSSLLLQGFQRRLIHDSHKHYHVYLKLGEGSQVTQLLKALSALKNGSHSIQYLWERFKIFMKSWAKSALLWAGQLYCV